MMRTSRRTVLGALASAAAAVPAFGVRELSPGAAAAAATADTYGSNTELYADPGLAEGTDYVRRYHRHGLIYDPRVDGDALVRTAVLALHGGGIETGTSELCLAIAGYHPATLLPAEARTPLFDYWMFEGVRNGGNTELHVTSTHCDDPVALALCGGARRAVSLHGFNPEKTTPDLPKDASVALVGGRDTAFKQILREELAAKQIDARDAAAYPDLAGDSPGNVVNKTISGMGAQLELSTALRESMFRVNSREKRKSTTLEPFWALSGAVRAAILRVEALTG